MKFFCFVFFASFEDSQSESFISLRFHFLPAKSKTGNSAIQVQGSVCGASPLELLASLGQLCEVGNFVACNTQTKLYTPFFLGALYPIEVITFFVCVCVSQLCLTLCDPMDCSPPGSSVDRVLQVRILEWIAIPTSRGSSCPKDQTWFSCFVAGFFQSFTVDQNSTYLLIEGEIIHNSQHSHYH